MGVYTQDAEGGGGAVTPLETYAGLRILIRVPERTLTCYQRDQIVAEYPVAVGKPRGRLADTGEAEEPGRSPGVTLDGTQRSLG